MLQRAAYSIENEGGREWISVQEGEVLVRHAAKYI